jgi:hypothetical protein
VVIPKYFILIAVDFGDPKERFFTVAESVLRYMVHKPIVRFVIAPVAVAGILMLAMLAATGNAQENNNAGSTQENNNAGSTQENNNAGSTQQQSNSTGNAQENNNAGSTQQQSNSTGNAQENNNAGSTQADLANSILAVHNSERAAVGVPPLVWSEKLATLLPIVLT